MMQNYVPLALQFQQPEMHCYLQHAANTQEHVSAIGKETLKIVVKTLLINRLGFLPVPKSGKHPLPTYKQSEYPCPVTSLKHNLWSTSWLIWPERGRCLAWQPRKKLFGINLTLPDQAPVHVWVASESLLTAIYVSCKGTKPQQITPAEFCSLRAIISSSDRQSTAFSHGEVGSECTAWR